MKESQFTWFVLSIGAAINLSGCGDGGIDEVGQWMNEVKQQTKVVVPKLSEPKRFSPFTYESKENLDPFSPAKLANALAKMRSDSDNPLKPDPDRRRELLETYPLDVLRMVGTLQKPSMSYALVLADKTVIQARVGNYIGQNFGMITNITETSVEIKEIVQDAAGEWVERKAKLELQETKK